MNIKSNRPEHNQEQNSSISFPINKNRREIKDNQTPAVEWARIAPNKVIVANAERAWLLEDTAQTNSSSSADQFLTQTMEGTGSIATTRQLLDGAIAAAKYAVNSDVRPPALTATRWIWRLAGQYHMCHIYPPLIKEAARRFKEAGHFTLAKWATEKFKEELGHDTLALKDIQSLGYDAKAIVRELIPPASKVFQNYFSRIVQDSNPIDCVGYSYTMERIALGIDKQYIQQIDSLFAPEIDATRCLRTHSSVGADAEHVKETIEIVKNLTSYERARIARACYETAIICFSDPQEHYISDKEIQQIVNSFRIQPCYG